MSKQMTSTSLSRLGDSPGYVARLTEPGLSPKRLITSGKHGDPAKYDSVRSPAFARNWGLPSGNRRRRNV